MVNTYVIAPHFSMAPPPRLLRPDETPLLPAQPAVEGGDLDGDGVPPLTERARNPGPAETAPAAATATVPFQLPPFGPLVELQLGDVIKQPFGAELVALNRDCRVPIPDTLLEKMGRLDGFSETRRNLLSGRLGVWASLFAAIGAGPEVNASIFWESRSTDTIEAAELQTRRFRVTKAYVDEVLAAQAVATEVAEKSLKELWMVSGMKYVGFGMISLFQKQC